MLQYQHRMTNLMQECLNHQKAILDDTLQVHKLDSPNVQLEMGPILPSSLIDSVLAMVIARPC